MKKFWPYYTGLFVICLSVGVTWYYHSVEKSHQKHLAFSDQSYIGRSIASLELVDIADSKLSKKHKQLLQNKKKAEDDLTMFYRELAKKVDDKVANAEEYYFLAEHFYRNDNYDKALKLSALGVKAAQDDNNKKDEAILLHALGTYQFNISWLNDDTGLLVDSYKSLKRATQLVGYVDKKIARNIYKLLIGLTSFCGTRFQPAQIGMQDINQCFSEEVSLIREYQEKGSFLHALALLEEAYEKHINRLEVKYMLLVTSAERSKNPYSLGGYPMQLKMQINAYKKELEEVRDEIGRVD